MRRKKNQICAFSWYGGKTYHLDWILPIINQVDHKIYIESFGGSAAVLLNKKPSPIEVYNDIHGDLVNFFRVLRTEGEDLISLLQLTPYSREEFVLSCEIPKNLSPLERARMFFVRARQIRNGLATNATPGKWSYTKKDVRRNWALPISQWFNAIDSLEDICTRIGQVQIENLDAFDIIQRYDTPESLHYIDPPYLLSSRTGGKNYEYEYNEDQHVNLINLLLNLKGKVVISGYKNELYPSLLKGWNEYRRAESFANTTLNNGEKKLRQEVIWTNFECSLGKEGWE
jgi:DNA adenine methylase